MERRQIKKSKKADVIEEKSKFMSELARDLWRYARHNWGNENATKVWNDLTRIYGKEPHLLTKPEEFWHPKLEKAVIELTSRAFLEDMKDIVRMRMEGQFSRSMWRRSFRSSDFGYHASWAILELVNCIYFYHGYDETVEEMLTCQHDWIRAYDTLLAIEIRKGNSAVIAAIREAILGENQNLLLTSRMIYAVIISGNEELIGLLMKLLLAAKQQEGVRQAILEAADAGSVQTLTRFLKVCLEEDLFRYSSVIRAFGTWSGLAYDNVKPALVKKAAEIAYLCLTDKQKRLEYTESENNQEAFLALWATGCHEMGDTDEKVRLLLEDEKKYRRILGWFFISHADNRSYQMRMASQHLKERDEEILAWVTSNLIQTSELMNIYGKENDGQPIENSDIPTDKAERTRLFYELKAVCDYIGNKNHTFTGNPFAFHSITYNNESVLRCMFAVVGYDMDQKLLEELASYLPNMDVYLRRVFYNNFLCPSKRAAHRAYLRGALNDKSIQVKELAVSRLSKCVLFEEDMEALAESLRSKSSGLRKAVLSVFKEQKGETLLPVIRKMLTAAEEYQVQAAIELLMEMKIEGFEAELKTLGERKLSTQTVILLEQLTKSGEAQETFYTEENGFGLYDPAKVEETSLKEKEECVQPEKNGLLQKIFGKKEEAEKIRMLYPDETDFNRLLVRMNEVFVRNADYEYEIERWDGAHEKILFGNAYQSIQIPLEYGSMNNISAQGGKMLEMIPFKEEFIAALGDFATDVNKMIGLTLGTFRYTGDQFLSYEERQPWFKEIENKGMSRFYNGYGKYQQRYWQMIDVFALLYQHFDSHTVFEAVLPIYEAVIREIGEENLGRDLLKQKDDSVIRVHRFGHRTGNLPINYRPAGILRFLLQKTAATEEDFRKWFTLEYPLERKVNGSIVSGLVIGDYFRACDMGIIPKDVLYERLMVSRNAANDMEHLTNTVRWNIGKKIYEKYDWAELVVKQIVNRTVEVESKRGELVTPLTPVARSIHKFEGAEYFCNLLAALGKENFFRGYEFSSDTTKRAVLSRLLKRCYPRKEDTPESLKALLDKTDIKDKRLAEAVMYAPQWADFAEKILEWPGLKSAVWFFHAHINETFSAEKETEVALYSPISPQQFNDGAFDKDWFFEAYNELGDKRFQILYKSAKYITTGNSQHRRSQLYSDAVLGRLDANELKAEIIEKRNQEKLRCYPLVPLDMAHPEEALRRYEFIQKFLKESRQFGAQRRESEKKACTTALENLAITTGFMDVNRMTWYLESEKIEEIRPMMEPREFGEVEVWMEIGEDGQAELAVSKKGKRQKTLPKALNKNEYILKLKETIKELREQQRRARASLEKAMCDGTEFGISELQKILGNPVLAPMVRDLIWTDGETSGFLSRQEDGQVSICNVLGKTAGIREGKLRVAHPHDLKGEGKWSDYMHVLYEKQIKQPFKQVFREYYPVTCEEKQERIISRRYAGHQVQPQKTVALLRGRGWTVDYDEGLQKVYYKENLIVRMYALADWFSPADIEAPTLEEIRFYDRKTGETVALEEVPAVVFSETMRDIDLVVSVAHVGGVDPEASHSTVEMRMAIAKELMLLLKLANVEFVGNHAKIQGSLSNYSVHMGSGVVHSEGSGMIAVLPVHSQARGRIFLPFADDDPKTAEIMSKIIMLSDDKKIKDPGILRQI